MKPAGLFIYLAILTLPAMAAALSEMQTLLDLHNAYRARQCVPPLSCWSFPQVRGDSSKKHIGPNRCVFGPCAIATADLVKTSPGARVFRRARHSDSGTKKSANIITPPQGSVRRVISRRSLSMAGQQATRLRRGAMSGARCSGLPIYSPPGNVEGEFRANVPPVCR